MKKLIPADTVDTAGNVWKTTGENIRYGAKEFSEDDVKAIVDIIFPIGSIFLGENTFIQSVGTWEPVPNSNDIPLHGSVAIPTGSVRKWSMKGTESAHSMTVRIWRRVS